MSDWVERVFRQTFCGRVWAAVGRRALVGKHRAGSGDGAGHRFGSSPADGDGGTGGVRTKAAVTVGRL